MTNFSPKTTGFFQALGITVYISFFALAVHAVQQKAVTPHPILGVIIFLLTFIISAIICGSIAFAYPISLFFENRKLDAIYTILWSVSWLIIFFLIMGLTIFMFV